MKSIMQEQYNRCYLCGSNGTDDMCGLEEHHIFPGDPNRKKSEKYGLKVKVCGCKCHREGPGSLHKNKSVRMALQAAGQMKFEEIHGDRNLFRKEFGKNWL